MSTAQVLGRERPVGVEPAGQGGGVEPLLRDLAPAPVRRPGTARAPPCSRPPSRGRRSAAARPDGAWRPGRAHRAGGSRDRAARALELVRLAVGGAGREDEGRPVEAVLDARGHDADHAFVEVGAEDADRGRRRQAVVEQRLGQQQGLVAHAAFDVAPLAVDAVEHAREFVGAAGVVGQQAFDAERHVGEPAGRVDARARARSRSRRWWPRRACGPRPRTAPRCPPASRRRGCGAGPGPPGGGCWRRAAPRRRRCRARPAAAGRRAWAGWRASKTPRARSSARSASST